jgi:hypothetical protein
VGRPPRYGQTELPQGLTNVITAAVGFSHSLALRSDGTVIAWGDNRDPASAVPAHLKNVVAIAAGFHSLALIGDAPPVVQASLARPTWSADGFSASLPTQCGRVYALQYKLALKDLSWTSLPLVAGIGHEGTLTDHTAAGGQRFYRVRQ